MGFTIMFMKSFDKDSWSLCHRILSPLSSSIEKHSTDRYETVSFPLLRSSIADSLVKRNGIVSICCEKEENRRVTKACEGVEASFHWGQGLFTGERRRDAFNRGMAKKSPASFPHVQLNHA